jgi:hypothetical protein
LRKPEVPGFWSPKGVVAMVRIFIGILILVSASKVV